MTSRAADAPHRTPFLIGVFLITFAVLVFQIVQTRILSVIAWYYLAFFAISVAMLGMTAGAVWVYLQATRFTPGPFRLCCPTRRCSRPWRCRRRCSCSSA